jgi:hypothetical protein
MKKAPNSLPSRPEPARAEPAATWEHLALWRKVRAALASLPVHFRSDTFIEGINATDIFTLNSALGATIENQVVDTLNQIRGVWDPDNRYQTLAFIRQPQTFPDVVLRDVSDSSRNPILGIELNGWYLLAQEGEPSLRFTQTAAACAQADLIMVVPWVLGNVISGRPKIYAPFMESARYVAQHRNHHWQHLREAKSNSAISIPSGITPYPRKTDASTDKPLSDTGGNFGRIARTGIMDNYMTRTKAMPLCGIKASHWLDFFKIFHQDATETEITAAFDRLKTRIASEPLRPESPDRAELLRVVQILEKSCLA